MRVRKKGRARGFRTDIEVETILENYMKEKSKEGKRINESDLINEAVRCFLTHSDCVARFKFEKRLETKTGEY